MSIHRKVGRFRTLTAAVLLAITLAALIPSAQPAHAQQACTPIEPNSIENWGALYNDRGVTVCYGFETGIGDPLAYVQIVDLTAGAKLRLISDLPTGTLQFNKRTADAWFNWIQSNVTTPAPGRLFSTTNASFFVDTSGPTSEVSLPQHGRNGDGTAIHTVFGYAFSDHTDPAWDALKRAVAIANPSSSTQFLEFFDFPTHYNIVDIVNAFPSQVYDGTVGFQPLYGSSSGRRTFLGYDGGRAYILNTVIATTLGDAQDILKSFGSVVELQLDGGASTQAYSPELGGFILPPVITREVPDTLAVYLAP